METLDSALEQAGVQQLDALKIDTEGAEALVRRGARRLLTNCRPLVQFEVNEAASRALGLAVGDAWHALAAHGYRFFGVSGAGSLSELSAPRKGNVLALPGERA